MRTIKSIGIGSLAVMLGTLYGVLGLIGAVGFLCFALVSGEQMGPEALFALAIPVIYAIAGFIGGALVAFLYNVLAGFVGGIKIELD